MKTTIFYLLIVLFLSFLTACDDNNQNQSPQKIAFNGKLISHTGCKDALRSASIYTDTVYITYSYDIFQKKISIKHVNASFNCCPDSFSCEISLKNDTIFILEKEYNPICDCNCNYDLDFQLQGVDPKEYPINIGAYPYSMADGNININIDLLNKKADTIIVH